MHILAKFLWKTLPLYVSKTSRHAKYWVKVKHFVISLIGAKAVYVFVFPAISTKISVSVFL